MLFNRSYRSSRFCKALDEVLRECSLVFTAENRPLYAPESADEIAAAAAALEAKNRGILA